MYPSTPQYQGPPLSFGQQGYQYGVDGGMGSASGGDMRDCYGGYQQLPLQQSAGTSTVTSPSVYETGYYNGSPSNISTITNPPLEPYMNNEEIEVSRPPPCFSFTKVDNYRGKSIPDLYNGTSTKTAKLGPPVPSPPPRHGHRAVACGNLMIFYGGGNDGLKPDLYVFDVSTHQWFRPVQKGQHPEDGLAAFGMTVIFDSSERPYLLIFGGMREYGIYSSKLYLVDTSTWTWKILDQSGLGIPPGMIGHSFTYYEKENFTLLFGGLMNQSHSPQWNFPGYMDTLYTLKIKQGDEGSVGVWEVPYSFGEAPCARESHSAVIYTSKDKLFNRLYIYGGMNGWRLGDLHFVDLDSWNWVKVESRNCPAPRSLHTATVIGQKMYIFGGWIPMAREEVFNGERVWKCTNSLHSFDLETLEWEHLHIRDDRDINSMNGIVPGPRAGHSAVEINGQIYFCMGRDGYATTDNEQICYNDVWKLEVSKPGIPENLRLSAVGTDWIDLAWNPAAGADSYVVQCIPCDSPIPNMNTSPNNPPSSASTISGVVAIPKVKDLAVTTPAAATTASPLPQSAPKQVTIVLSPRPIQGAVGQQGATTTTIVKKPVTVPYVIKTNTTVLPTIPYVFNNHSINIKRVGDMVHISWDPVLNTSGAPLEYKIFICMKSCPPGNQTLGYYAPLQNGKGNQQFPFVRVYHGASTSCSLPLNTVFSNVFVEPYPKPAIIFRMIAQNNSVTGSISQIRWQYAEDITKDSVCSGVAAIGS